MATTADRYLVTIVEVTYRAPGEAGPDWSVDEIPADVRDAVPSTAANRYLVATSRGPEKAIALAVEEFHRGDGAWRHSRLIDSVGVEVAPRVATNTPCSTAVIGSGDGATTAARTHCELSVRLLPMVNEPMPWNLTVAQLREFLADRHPNAIVGTAVTPELVEQLHELTAGMPPRAAQYLNFEIASDPGKPTVMLRLRVPPRT